MALKDSLLVSTGFPKREKYKLQGIQKQFAGFSVANQSGRRLSRTEWHTLTLNLLTILGNEKL